MVRDAVPFSELEPKDGITSEDEIERLYEGNSDRKLHVPCGLRGTLQNIGLGAASAPLNVMTILDKRPILISEDAWEDLEFEVALDSGAVVHVCSLQDCPGYKVSESPGSRRGQDFLMGDGGTTPNLG